MHNRLLTLVAFLISVVVGCDDPEVQEKVESVMEHGSVSAELTCSLYDATAPGNRGLPGNILYSASKLIDGSCLTQICLGQPAAEALGPASYNRICQTHLRARSSDESLTCKAYVEHDPHDGLYSSTKPFRLGIDGTYAFVEDGLLYVEVRDNYFTQPGSTCNGGSCTDPEPWLSYDITASACTGRNLEAFGVTP
jgi:hypothetical protein